MDSSFFFVIMSCTAKPCENTHWHSVNLIYFDYISRRDRSYNYFSLMVQKRLKESTEEDGATKDEEKTKKATPKTKSLVSI